MKSEEWASLQRQLLLARLEMEDLLKSERGHGWAEAHGRLKRLIRKLQKQLKIR